jgi:roadblock/LC7 domain-containing protein
MASLDELLQVEGVAAAGEFGLDGTLIGYRANMDMSPEMAAMSAQFCASVSMLFNTLGGAFTQMSGMSWAPQQGWAYSGGDWTVAVGEGGRKGVFIETAKADFNRLFGLLVGEQASA